MVAKCFGPADLAEDVVKPDYEGIATAVFSQPPIVRRDAPSVFVYLYYLDIYIYTFKSAVFSGHVLSRERLVSRSSRR